MLSLDCLVLLSSLVSVFFLLNFSLPSTRLDSLEADVFAFANFGFTLYIFRTASAIVSATIMCNGRKYFHAFNLLRICYGFIEEALSDHSYEAERKLHENMLAMPDTACVPPTIGPKQEAKQIYRQGRDCIQRPNALNFLAPQCIQSENPHLE